MIARAKSTGDQIWYHLKLLGQTTQATHNQNLERFWAMSNAYALKFADKELGKFLSLEMFLRAGKKMANDVKIENRKEADRLKEKILRRMK